MKGVLVAAAVVAALSLGACASSARSTQMAPAAEAVQAATPGQVGYKALKVGEVKGGGSTNPMWMSNISAADYRSALESALRAANYLSDDPSKATVEVSADLQKVNRPMAGFDMTVNTTVRYTGVAAQSNAKVFDQVIAGAGTAKMGDALLGVERLRIANEKSAQENIKAFIARLPELLKDLAQPAS